MLKIDAAYKIKHRDIDAFFADMQYRSIMNMNDNHTGDIFTVVGVPNTKKNNWYYEYFRYIVLFKGKQVLYLFRPETKTGIDPSFYLEEITE